MKFINREEEKVKKIRPQTERPPELEKKQKQESKKMTGGKQDGTKGYDEKSDR